VAIVGATGLVGRTLLQVLEERRFPLRELRLLASERSREKSLPFRGEQTAIEELSKERIKNLDIAFFATDAAISREFVPLTAGDGALVIDNSSAFRLEAGFPLVVPEVNGEEIFNHQRVIANPNCSTIQLVVVLAPLQRHFGLKRVIVSTYQSVSGSGQKGLDQFFAEVKGEHVIAPFYPYPIFGNCLPQIGAFDEDGYSEEEVKIMAETKKILGLPELPITATAVRVPVPYCHCESANVQLQLDFNLQEVRQVLAEAPGVVLVDGLTYPIPQQARGRDGVFVGRLRRDPSVERGINLWIVADNLRKGAATNAVQIAEVWIQEKERWEKLNR